MNSSTDMTPDAVLHLWEFENAPEALKELVSPPHAGGWLAFVCPGGAEDLVEGLLAQWSSQTLQIVRLDLEGGGTVLAGPHPVGPPT